MLFRAVAGLWPWGKGRIAHPARQSMMFLPIRPYVPPGALRTAVAYPRSTDAYDETAVADALAEIGLERLLPMLDTIERWDQRLTDAEKQCLAFARVILQRPTWIVLNDALDVLDSESRRRIEAVFSRELANVGVINIGHAASEKGLYARTLHIVSDPLGPTIELNSRRQKTLQEQL